MSNSVNLSLDVTKTGIQNPLIKVRQGDGGFETLRTTVTANGEPMDLQGWTITFMGTTAGNHKIVDGNITLVEAPNGIFDYTPSKAWGMDIGDFKIAYFKFVKGDGSASSANFRVSIIEAVDLTQEEAQHYISVIDATIAEVREHLESSLADVSSSVAATSVAASSMAVFVSSKASSAASQANSAAANVSSVASNAVAAVAAASNTYVQKSNELPAVARDFGYLAQHMQEYQGFWWNGVESIANAPADNWTWSVIEVIPGNAGSNGLIRTMRTSDGIVYSTNVNFGYIQHWTKFADDAQLVHKTGAETIAGDKTFTGKVTSSQPIDGALSTRTPAFTDFNDVAKNMVKYSGSWVIGTQSIANSPLQNYYTAIITPGFSGGTDGYIELVPFAGGSSKKYIAVVGSGTLSAWKSFAFDDDVVHKNGTEMIAGDKTFTSPINGNLSGNAATATKWQTPRTLALTGDVTGSTSVDGSGDVSITTTGADLVHKTGAETIAGDKIFTGKVTFSGTFDTAKVTEKGVTMTFTRFGNIVTVMGAGNYNGGNVNSFTKISDNVVPSVFLPNGLILANANWGANVGQMGFDNSGAWLHRGGAVLSNGWVVITGSWSI